MTLHYPGTPADDVIALALAGYALQPLAVLAENGAVPGAVRTARGWSFSRDCLAAFGKAQRAHRWRATGYVDLNR